MFKTLFNILFIFVTALCVAGDVAAQKTVEAKPVNFGYSQNPKTRTRPVETARNIVSERPGVLTDGTGDSGNGQQVSQALVTPPPSIAAKTMAIAKKANTVKVSPTDIYKVGAGDVLLINLQNAAKASSYFTVLNDGRIDYPLAGEMVFVGGMTVEEIEDTLREKIKLYDDPRVSVKVREYGSHTVTITGLVENSGAKNIQREAVPLFVIKAGAVVQPKAAYAVIKRAGEKDKAIQLKDPAADNTLIYPGDWIEFSAGAAGGDESTAFYFIAGEVAAAGQKDFHEGLTLSQAIAASGGTKRPNVKKAVIRRKNDAGFLVPLEFSLKSIKNGKQADPQLQAGDTIEISN